MPTEVVIHTIGKQFNIKEFADMLPAYARKKIRSFETATLSRHEEPQKNTLSIVVARRVLRPSYGNQNFNHWCPHLQVVTYSDLQPQCSARFSRSSTPSYGIRSRRLVHRFQKYAMIAVPTRIEPGIVRRMSGTYTTITWRAQSIYIYITRTHIRDVTHAHIHANRLPRNACAQRHSKTFL